METTDLTLNGRRRLPQLRLAPEHSPLARVSASFGLLGLLSKVLSGRKAEVKVAVVIDLQSSDSVRWKIRDLQQSLYWLEPEWVNEIVHDLRSDGALSYDSFSNYYQLTAEGRLIAAVVSALTVPAVDTAQKVKFLNIAMHLAETMSAAGELVFAQFRSAKAILREDHAELRTALDEGHREGIRRAADNLAQHARHLEEMVQEHQAFFARYQGDPRWAREEYEAFQLASTLGRDAALVLDRLNAIVDELARGLILLDKGDIREFVEETAEKDLIALVGGLIEAPPFIAWFDTELALVDLGDLLEQERTTTPILPNPELLTWEMPGEPAPDPIREMSNELVALNKPNRFLDFVVQRNWSTSVARHAALVGAYAEHDHGLPLIVDPEPPGVDNVGRDEVWRISKSLLRPKS